MPDHILTCRYETISCSGCNEMYKRMDMVLHELNCPLIQVNCNYCSKKIIRKELNDHEEKCEERLVDCPLQCKQKIKEKDLKKHLNENNHCVQLFEKLNILENKLSSLYKNVDSFFWSLPITSAEDNSVKIKVSSVDFCLKGYEWYY
jgi:hypothetical protein